MLPSVNQQVFKKADQMQATIIPPHYQQFLKTNPAIRNERVASVGCIMKAFAEGSKILLISVLFVGKKNYRND